jgi:hypothetical protein
MVFGPVGGVWVRRQPLFVAVIVQVAGVVKRAPRLLYPKSVRRCGLDLEAVS